MTENKKREPCPSALVSVIVPVYNAGMYLTECIESLRRQTYRNMEVILIDDGSTDQSGMICDEAAGTDNRFKVYHNSNHGVSFSRNLGIDLAGGDYLIFVDSDDRVEPAYVEKLIYPAEHGYDLSICGLKEIITDKGIVKSRKKKGALSGNLQKDMYHLMPFLRVPVCKAYRRSIVNKYNIRFNTSISYGEDQLFNYMYYYHVKTCAFVDEDLYIYNHHSDSLSDWTKLRTFRQVKSAIRRLSFQKEFMDRYDPYKKEIIMNDDVMTAISNFCDVSSYKLFKKQAKALCRFRYEHARMDRLKRVVFCFLLDRRLFLLVFIYCRLFKYSK